MARGLQPHFQIPFSCRLAKLGLFFSLEVTGILIFKDNRQLVSKILQKKLNNEQRSTTPILASAPFLGELREPSIERLKFESLSSRKLSLFMFTNCKIVLLGEVSASKSLQMNLKVL